MSFIRSLANLLDYLLSSVIVDNPVCIDQPWSSIAPPSPDFFNVI